MQITLDHTAGYCTGVERSIRIAEQELEKGESIYCLGDIIHNEQEMNRLRSKGLQIIDTQIFRELKNARVLIRAHGEPPETFLTASENNITLINATCNIVSNLQHRIREEFNSGITGERQFVILGKRDHPEVIGLNGQIQGSAIIIQDESGLKQIDFRKPVLVYTQTTFSIQQYESMRKRMVMISNEIPRKERGVLLFHNSICRQVLNRERSLRNFSKEHEVIVFVSDHKSSNGRYLFGICQTSNPKCFFINDPVELQPSWFARVQTVGITGATSTPVWLMQKVAERTAEIVSS